jgi:hypothetical protein
MSTHLLIVATDEPERALAERVVETICEAWRDRGAMPAIEHVSIRELMERIGRETWAQPHGVLAILGDDASASLPAQIVDSMHRALAPGVVMLPEVDARMARLATGGILLDTWTADPARVASALFALCERQRTVRELCDEIDRLSSFQGGLHGEMTRLHDELNLAAMIQRELLPKSVPVVDGVEFGVLFRPAGYVSGDIYDVTPISDECVGFFIADAVGHGVPAALLTVVISRSLRFIPHRDGLDVSASLARLNDEMIACQRDTHRFATAIAGTVNTRTREVTLASAGHPPALRIGSSTRTAIDSGGPLLGVFPDQDFPSVTFTLEDDETLLLYSDGFETAFSSEGLDIRKAKQAYLDRLCSIPWPIGEESRSLKAAFTALGELLDRQSGSLHQLDDLTALAIAPTRGAVEARRAA